MFIKLHNQTGKAFQEVSNWGEARLVFNPKTFCVSYGYDIKTSESKIGNDTKILPITIINAEKSPYCSRNYIPKLVWTKCPKPIGVSVAPWAPHLLYIAAGDNGSVLIMDLNKYKIIGKLVSPNMAWPHGLALRRSTMTVFVSDKWKHCIHQFSSQGKYLSSFCSKGSGEGNLRNPEAIAMGPNENLLVCDTGNDRVVILDPDNGKQLSVVGVNNKRTEFNMPTGVSMSGNTIVIADSGNHKIKLFSQFGLLWEKILEFGSMGKGKGQFHSAEVVACDSNGMILVGDSGNARLQIFNSVDGSLVRTFGGYGEDKGKFTWVSGIAVTPQFDIVATDHKNRRIQIF